MSDKFFAKMYVDYNGNVAEILRKAPLQKGLLLASNKPLMQEMKDAESIK